LAGALIFGDNFVMGAPHAVAGSVFGDKTVLGGMRFFVDDESKIANFACSS
jgi:hypothetical protein